jgi:hypothetical protein
MAVFTAQEEYSFYMMLLLLFKLPPKFTVHFTFTFLSFIYK